MTPSYIELALFTDINGCETSITARFGRSSGWGRMMNSFVVCRAPVKVVSLNQWRETIVFKSGLKPREVSGSWEIIKSWLRIKILIRNCPGFEEYH